METLVELAKIILLLSASALCVYLILVLIRLRGVLEILQVELIELNKNLKPLLENLNTVSEKLRAIAVKVDDQVNMVHGVFVAFKHVTDNVLHFEERIQSIFEEPLKQVGSLLVSIIGRFGSFFSHRA